MLTLEVPTAVAAKQARADQGRFVSMANINGAMETQREREEREKNTKSNVLCVLHLLFAARHFAKTLGELWRIPLGREQMTLTPLHSSPKYVKLFSLSVSLFPQPPGHR